MAQNDQEITLCSYSVHLHGLINVENRVIYIFNISIFIHDLCTFLYFFLNGYSSPFKALVSYLVP
jgi:hypothetical protein